jgi:hypothetical protein
VYGRALTATEIAERAALAEPAPLDGVSGEWVFDAKPGRKILPVAGTLTLQAAGTGLTSLFDGELVGEAPPPEESLCLWYRQPAMQWVEALPIGNGRLGAMVFGGPAGSPSPPACGPRRRRRS